MWSTPRAPWVLHTTQTLGNLTDRWIGVLTASTDRYESRLLGLEAPDMKRRADWLVAGDRLDLRLAWRAIQKSRGRSSAWLARPLRFSKPSIVHAHYGTLAANQLPLARQLDAALIASFYGYDATEERFTESRRWRRAYRRLFDAASAIVVEGPEMADRLVHLGCAPEKISVVRLPADAVSLAALDLPDESSEFVVSVAGQFIEKKGFDVAIRAFARALGDRGDARLSIVGGGPLELEYRRIATEERIDGQVRWSGRLPFEQFMARVGAARIGLYPSRTAANGDSEGGAPVTLIEAQWMGVPALVSTHDDLPFVTPADSIVLEPDDLDGWSEALRAMYDDPARLEVASRSARHFAREHHSPAVNVRAREAIYDAAS